MWGAITLLIEVIIIFLLFGLNPIYYDWKLGMLIFTFLATLYKQY